MPQQDVGRRIRMSIGITESKIRMMMQSVRRSKKLKRRRQKSWPKLCSSGFIPYPTCPFLIFPFFRGFAPTNSAESILNGAGASDENKEVSEAPEGELSPTVDNQSESAKKLEKRMRKLEKRARKAEKKERKEKRRLERLRDDDYDRERVHDTRYKERRSRSRSPPRRNAHDERDRHHGRRSASPPPRGRLRSRSPPRRDGRGYDDAEYPDNERDRYPDRRREEEFIRRDRFRNERYR